MNAITNYLKAHVALVGAVGTWLVAALKDGQVSGQEWYGLALAVATGLGVAAVPNRKKRHAAKDAGAAEPLVLLAVVVLIFALIGGFALSHWLFLLVILAVLLLFT